MRILKTFLILNIVLFLTGCWDKVELEDRGLVLSIGLDKKDDKFLISMEIPEYSEKSDSSSIPTSEESNEVKDKSTIKSAEGVSIYSAMKLIDTHTNQNLYYGHTKVAIIGKELLQNENYLKEAIDALERNQEISRKIILLATKEDAKDVLNENNQKELGLYINNFYKSNINNSSFTFRQDLEEVIQNLLSSGDTIIPEIEVVDDNVQISGLAIIKDYKLVNWLDEEMTKSFLWFNKDKNIRGEISVPFEEGHVPLKITGNNSKITMEANDKILTNINIDIEGNIGEYMLTKNIMTDTDKYKILETKYENKIKEEVSNLLEYLKNNIKSDIIDLKEICRKNYYDIYNKFNLEENDIYDFTEFNVNVDVKIKSSGNIK